MLFTIGFGGAASSPDLRKRLQEYAVSTGGRAFFPHDTKQLDEVFGTIVAELSNQYVLSYSPANPDARVEMAHDHGPRPEGAVRHPRPSGVSQSRLARGEIVMHTRRTLFTLLTTPVPRRGPGVCSHNRPRPRRNAATPKPVTQEPASARPHADHPSRRRQTRSRRRSARARNSSRSTSASSIDRDSQCAASAERFHGHRRRASQGGSCPSSTSIRRRRRPRFARRRPNPNPDAISTNEGAGVGRLIVFLVDQSSLEPGACSRSPVPPRAFSTA